MGDLTDKIDGMNGIVLGNSGKFTRAALQTLVGLPFLGPLIEDLSEQHFLQNYEQQVIDLVGSAGYQVLGAGETVMDVGITGLIAYIAVKGTGMYLDKLQGNSAGQ